MNSYLTFLKTGFRFNRGRLKLAGIVFAWTAAVLFLTRNSFQTKEPSTQFLILILILFLMENFITCCVYAALKESVLSKTWTWKEFSHSGFYYFMRFLSVKIFLVLMILAIYGFSTDIIISGLSNLPLAAQGIFYAVLVCWLAFPVYFFSLLLFAPLIVFADNCPVPACFQRSFAFTKKNFESLLITGFLFVMIIFLVNFPVKLYNFEVAWWLFLKSAILSFAEVGFISTFFALYMKDNKSYPGEHK